MIIMAIEIVIGVFFGLVIVAAGCLLVAMLLNVIGTVIATVLNSINRLKS